MFYPFLRNFGVSRCILLFITAVALLAVGFASVIFSDAYADNPNSNMGGNTTLSKLDCTTDQIAKFDGVEWRYAADKSGNTVIVRDANDDEVATVMPVGNVAYIQDSEGRTRNLLVQIVPTNIFNNNTFATVSADPACTGTQYVSVESADMSLGAPFSSVAEPVYTPCPVGCGPHVSLYIPSSDEPIMLAGPIYSVNNSGGVCWQILPAGQSISVYLAEDISTQFAGIGTPPFYWDLK